MSRVFRVGACGMAAALCACGIMGCNIVGPAFMMIHGPEMTQAKYTLEKDKTHIVFVDDRENVLRDRTLRRVIAQACEERLLERNAVPKAEIISSIAAEEATAGDRWGKPLGIAQVGQSCKADRVIYATIDTFTVSLDGTSLAPFASMRVKVVDTTSKKRVWPEGAEDWHIVNTKVSRRDGTIPQSMSALSVEENLLAQRLGRDLAHVFVEHQSREPENAIRSPER